jgi:CIC family chloride channel protein
MVAAAALAAACAGAAAAAFHALLIACTLLFSGSADYSLSGGGTHPWFRELGPWFVLLVPPLGGLLYGPIVARFAPEARGGGVPDVRRAVAERRGFVPGRVAVVKSIATAVSLGSGGSAGREGPLVQIGAAIGSEVGSRLKVPLARLPLLTAAAATGAFAAGLGAPVTAVAFSAEILLVDFSAYAVVVLAVAGVVGTLVGAGLSGGAALLAVDPSPPGGPVSYLAFAIFGVATGLVGVVFIRAAGWTTRIWDRLWRWPEWLRPAVGGVLLGPLLVALPELYGVGSPVLHGAVAGRYLTGFLLLLVLGKIVATSLTMGIGGAGGVFGPLLFIGATFGAAFGAMAHAWWPATGSGGSVFAVLGIAGVLAAGARAPVTAIALGGELTGDYRLLPALFVVTAIATVASRWLSAETIYTLQPAAPARKTARSGTDTAAVHELTDDDVPITLSPSPTIIRVRRGNSVPRRIRWSRSGRGSAPR